MPSPERTARLLLVALTFGTTLIPRATSADPTSPPSFSPTADGRQRITSHLQIGKTPAPTSMSSGGWWLGSAGIAVALAVFGGISLASRKYLPKSETSPLRVIGRTSLSPRHSVYLLKAGDKVLIIGTGPQGSPTLLGEIEPDAAETSRLTASMTPRLRVGGGV